jgi:hypothetical protein
MQIFKSTLLLLLFILTGAFVSPVSAQYMEEQPPSGHSADCNLPAPNDVTLDFVTPTSAQLSWTPVPGAVGYATELTDLSENITYNLSTPVNSILYNSAYIKPGHDYRFRVASECSNRSHGAFGEEYHFNAPVVVIIDIVMRNGTPEQSVGSGQFSFPLNTPTDGSCQYNFDIVHTNDEGKELRYEFLSYPHPNDRDLAIEHHRLDGTTASFGPANASNSGPVLYVKTGERLEEDLIATISTIKINDFQPAVDINIIDPNHTQLFMIFRCEGKGEGRSNLQSGNNAGTTAPDPATYVQQTETDDIKAWPNPAQEQIFLEFSVAQDAPFSLQLFDQLGRLQGSNAAGTQTLSAGKHLIQYPIASLPSGMYLLHVRVGNSTKTLKIIKQ